MPDYGNELRFGWFLEPVGVTAEVLGAARLLDELGYDLIGVQDHPYQRRHFDTWSLMAVILGRTDRVRVFPDVANLPLRPPAVMAKAAASLDQLSGGRFELGLGAGSFWEAIGAMGGPVRAPAEALAALAEAIEIIRGMWSQQRNVRVRGEHYRVDGVRPGPPPAHELGIWLGVYRPRALALTGRAADGWVPSMGYLPPRAAAAAGARIDAAAREAGRDPSAIRRVYNISGAFTAAAPAAATDDDQAIVGPVDHWVEVLVHLAADVGFDSFVFGFGGPPDPDALRTFVAEVAPAVRERVAALRASRSA
jgi:alkanesulfonate monooxygenase SsuD/methylene tetrahydromethanopterin reductase-like flavin-dependent oxidoreductase (luciferase family)